MRRRRVLGLALLAGVPIYLRRRREATRERVHIHFDDGSTVTLADDALEGERLLALARRAL